MGLFDRKKKTEIKAAKEGAVIAWVGTSCSWCGWSGKVEVTEKDAQGKMIVRCPECKERIKMG